jgi:hypothetical protein
MNYRYHFAYDVAGEPWTGPYANAKAALLSASRDGGHERVIFIKSALEIGPNAFMDTGHVDRYEPGAYFNL